MPVPKNKQKSYGVIVGANMNRGMTLDEAKNIADRAIKHKEVSDKKLDKKYKKGGKKS